MRVLVFHGYLLRGTGSNVYNARLCAALARLGHTVDLLSQERRPEELGFVDAVGTWKAGEARVRVLRTFERQNAVNHGFEFAAQDQLHHFAELALIRHCRAENICLPPENLANLFFFTVRNIFHFPFLSFFFFFIIFYLRFCSKIISNSH